MIEKVIRISRVAKVTKGGTKLSFTALVVVGDGNDVEAAGGRLPQNIQVADVRLLVVVGGGRVQMQVHPPPLRGSVFGLRC